VPELNNHLGASLELGELKQDYQQAVKAFDVSNDKPADYWHEKFEQDEPMSLTELAFAHQKYPDDPIILIAFIELLDDNGYLEMAYQLIETHFECHGISVDLLNGYGSLLIQSSELDKSDDFFASLSPDTHDETMLLACLWLKVRRFSQFDPAQSLVYLEQYLAIFPDAIRALNGAATVARDVCRYDESTEYWQQLIELDPEQTELYHWAPFVFK
jgi:tetratricopeptide (TPR) repeat protein